MKSMNEVIHNILPMTFLTIFSAPKPFVDLHIRLIQRNAIASWCRLGADVEVILAGEEPGLAETAHEFGVRHLAQVGRNRLGTPLVSSIFGLVQANSTTPLLAYVNADILLLTSFVTMARWMMERKGKFLLVGQRWDLDVGEPLEFSPGWAGRLEDQLQKEGSLHAPAGSDYFIFPRGCFEKIPDFSIGRAGWDNWMIFEARRQGWQTVDATKSITIIHQQHDYAHLPGGQPHHHLPETDENIRLAGGREVTRFSLLDADHQLVNGRLRNRSWNFETLRRAIETYPLLKWNNYSLTAKFTSFFHRLKYKFHAQKVNP
jgi:hypothetical protein